MTLKLGEGSEGTIEDQIKYRVHRVLELAKSKEPISFYDVSDRWCQDLIMAYPGSGKTKTAITMANELWEKDCLTTLYVALSHSKIDEHLERLSLTGKDVDWAHWRGHEPTCERNVYNNAGYIGYGPCMCSRGKFTADRPTFAPIEYILPGLPDSNSALIESVYDFFYWIIDEIDFRRLLGQLVVNKHDVVTTAGSISDGSAQVLVNSLSSLMRSHKGFKLNGPDLYRNLAALTEKQGCSLADLWLSIRRANDLAIYPSYDLENSEVQMNFLPALIPLFVEEAEAFLSGEKLNPRVHLAGTGSTSELRLWWRKDLNDFGEGGHSQPPTLILDATADPELIEFVFHDHRVVENKLPSWPKNVHVFQWQDDLVTRSSLGMRFHGTVKSPKSIKERQRWYRRIVETLVNLSPTDSIGLITHKSIEEEAVEALKYAGFENVRSMHYGDERGSNRLEEVKALVILGLPIPNIEAFQEEAEAFFYDAGDLDFTWESRTLNIDTVDGESVPVTVNGYWNGYVGKYYRQKCQSSLFQAFHRIRPYLVSPEEERYVFLFTNMPVEGVIVEGLLRDPEKLRIERRLDTVTGILQEYLLEAGECTTSSLVGILDGSEEVNQASIRRWINENASEIAKRVNASFITGSGRRTGVFKINKRNTYI